LYSIRFIVLAMMTNTETTTSERKRIPFKIWLDSGEVAEIETWSEEHARQTISRGRKVGRYHGKIVRLELIDTNTALERGGLR
jgi:hypothetical protein